MVFMVLGSLGRSVFVLVNAGACLVRVRCKFAGSLFAFNGVCRVFCCGLITLQRDGQQRNRQHDQQGRCEHPDVDGGTGCEILEPE